MTDPPPIDVTAIADLLAWARRLTEQGCSAEAAERAAYQAAKTTLLARIAAQQSDITSTNRPDGRVND